MLRFRAPKAKGRFLRRISQVLLFCVFASVFVATPHAYAGGISLTVDQWDRDVATGIVSYDVTMQFSGAAAAGQPCASWCTWTVEAFFEDGSIQQLKTTLGSGGARLADTYSKRLTATDVKLAEITDLRATLTADYNEPRESYTSSWYHVSDPYPTGDITVAVNSWDRNVDSGAVSYNVRMDWTGASQVDGPCVGYCRWAVEAYYKDGTSEILQTSLGEESVGGASIWTYGKTLIGTSKKEITDLKATLAPYTAGNGETYTSWYEVSDPYPDGRIDVRFNTWNVNPSTGAITYNIRSPWVGAGQFRGPCASYCKWTIEGLYGSGQSTELWSDSTGGAAIWEYYGSASGTTTLPLTHIRATLYPYSSPSLNETYVSTVPVPGSPVGGIALDASTWEQDPTTNELTYDVDLLVTESSIQPLCASGCAWKIAGFYRVGGADEEQHVLGRGSLTSPLVAFGTRLSGTNLHVGPISHLEATLTPIDPTVMSDFDIHQVGFAPPPPTDFAAVDVQARSVSLVWEATGFEEHLELERSSDAFENVTFFNLPSGTLDFVDVSTAGLKEYAYRIRAVNDFGVSAWTHVDVDPTPGIILPDNSAFLDALANDCSSPLSIDDGLRCTSELIYRYHMHTVEVRICAVTNGLAECQNFLLVGPENPPSLPDDEDPSVPPSTPGAGDEPWVPPTNPGEEPWVWVPTEGTSDFPTRNGNWYQACAGGGSRKLHWDSPHGYGKPDHWSLRDCLGKVWELPFDWVTYGRKWRDDIWW